MQSSSNMQINQTRRVYSNTRNFWNLLTYVLAYLFTYYFKISNSYKTSKA